MSCPSPARGARGWIALATAAFLLSPGCRDPELAPSSEPPRLTVHSPVDTAYDADGDRLVDFNIEWHGTRLDPATARARSLDGLDGPANPDTNLLDIWRVDRRDSTGLVFHETRANMLPSGRNRIQISVADSGGRRTTDTITVTLPRGAFWKTVPTGLLNMVAIGSFAVDSTRRRLYLAHSRAIVVFDLDSLSVLAAVAPPTVGLEFNRLLLSPPDGLCVTVLLRCLDPVSLTWGPPFNSADAIPLAQSKANSDIIYLGEKFTGTVGIYSKAQRTRIGQVPYPPNLYNDEFVTDIVVLAGDAKLYETRSFDGGVLALDPRTGAVFARIGSGDATGLDLSRDEQHLYSTIGGVSEIDTRTDSITRSLFLVESVPIDLSLSPDGRLVFVVTGDFNPPNEPYSSNFLIDVEQWRIVGTFPRTRPLGQYRYDHGVSFHPSGKLAFVGHDLDLDVYVIRK